jgi:hypothetical protein
MAAIAAIIKIILRNIAVSPLHVCVFGPHPAQKAAAFLQTRAARGSSAPLVVLWIDISGSIRTPSPELVVPNSPRPAMVRFIEPAWREGA